ncbi:L-amino acid N-acyltransferase YncA [Bowdeniella nasicola]|uniref:L-amino acid N-acyltransferase YncA n=2 Tax=Bowdeniella nasicola TaxID=208480 RepID=A0A1H4D667_9ACTO|nr:L-amino acid N-acyltransferase YncA [Bowdeniella nasicola]
MTVADAAAVARIHVASWQHAYRGLLPSRVLDSLSIADRTAKFTRSIRKGGPVRYLVAEDGGTIIGFAAVGPCRDEDSSTDDSELAALYVHPLHLRAGAGRALLAKAKEAAKQMGCKRMILWVLKDNASARAFYKRCGMKQEATRGTQTIAGTDYVKMKYSARL